MSTFSAVFFGIDVTFLGDPKNSLNGLIILVHHSVVARTHELILGLVGRGTSRCVLPSVRLHFTSAFQELPGLGTAFGILLRARLFG